MRAATLRKCESERQKQISTYFHKFSFNLPTTNSELFEIIFWDLERLNKANVTVYFAKKKTICSFLKKIINKWIQKNCEKKITFLGYLVVRLLVGNINISFKKRC